MSEFNAEELQKIKEHVEKNNSIDGIYERFMNDISLYLQEKFPMEPLDAIGEASVYIGQRAIIMNQDALVARDREWQKIVDMYNSRLQRSYRDMVRKRPSMDDLAEKIDEAYNKKNEEGV